MSRISSCSSARGLPKAAHGIFNCTSDGPTGVGATAAGVWRPACEICIHKCVLFFVPLQRKRAAQICSLLCSPSITTLAGRSDSDGQSAHCRSAKCRTAFGPTRIQRHVLFSGAVLLSPDLPSSPLCKSILISAPHGKVSEFSILTLLMNYLPRLVSGNQQPNHNLQVRSA